MPKGGYESKVFSFPEIEALATLLRVGPQGSIAIPKLRGPLPMVEYLESLDLILCSHKPYQGRPRYGLTAKGKRWRKFLISVLEDLHLGIADD